MTQDRTENSRAPPMRHHGFKMVRRVSDTYKMCDCFILSCSRNLLIYRNIHFSKIYPRILKLQQKFTLFWIFPRIHTPGSEYLHNGKAQFYISAQLILLSSSCSAHWDKKYAYFGR